MAYTPTPQVSRYLLITIPVLLSLLAMHLSVLPIGQVAGIPVAPSLVLVSIFYWTVYRPEVFPIWLTFALGVCEDLIIGGALGVLALVYVVIQGVILNSRQFLIGTAAYSPWFAFFITTLMAGLGTWIVVEIYYWKWLSPIPYLVKALVTAAVYPIFAGFLSMVDQRAFGMR